MFNLWSTGPNRPSTPKRTMSTLKPPAPLTPKLTTTTTLSAGPIEYPPHVAYDAQWEHVRKQSPGESPSSSDIIEDDEDEDEDDKALARLGYSQVEGVERERPGPTRGAPPSAASTSMPPSVPAQVPASVPVPPAPAAAAAAARPPSSSVSNPMQWKVPPAQWQEERDRLRQQVEAALASQRKAESDRDRWERKVMELRSGFRSERERERDRDRDGTSSARSRRGERERDREREQSSTAEVLLKEENDKLKTMLQQQAQQLDVAREEAKQVRAQGQSEVERLKSELDAARAAQKEGETLKLSLQEHVSRIEHLTTDRERLRKDREAVRGNLSAEIEQLKLAHAKENEQFKKVLDEVNLDRTQAHGELRKVRKSLDAYAPKLDESVREIEALRRELSKAKESDRAVAELKQRLASQVRELYTAREESSALKKEFNLLATLLEDRTSELKGAQSFLTTADAFSGVEVTSTLQRLNAEVLQSTAFMAESMVEQFFHDTKPQVTKTDEQLAACKRASAAIGGSIVHFLGTKKHKDDPILIQIAFQAYLAYHLRWIACAWIIGGEEAHNQFIDAIYRSVQEKEAQAIAGRWRALTRAHVPLTSLDETQLTFQIATKIISGLSDILLTTGSTTPKSDLSSALSAKFADKLSFLISLAMRVNKIVGEDVTSGDFEVLAIPPGTAFESVTMEDSYDDGGSVKGKGNGAARVLCATDLGLRKKTRVGMTGEKQWETKVLLKPKVALESVIDIMDE